MDNREYWDMVANDKNFTTPFQSDLFKKYVDINNSILDIGCGYGRTLKELYDLGYRNLIGIDFSKEMIDRARNLYSYINFYVGNGNQLNFDNNSIDSVILLGVLTCIYNKNEQQDLIREIYRILKPSGILYINDFLLNDSSMYLERYNKYKDKYGDYGIFETSDGGIFRHHTKEYFDELLIDFKSEKVKTLTYNTMNGHNSNGIYYIGRKFNFID